MPRRDSRGVLDWLNRMRRIRREWEGLAGLDGSAALARREATLTCRRGRGGLEIGGLYFEEVYSRARCSATQRSVAVVRVR